MEIGKSWSVVRSEKSTCKSSELKYDLKDGKSVSGVKLISEISVRVK